MGTTMNRPVNPLICMDYPDPDVIRVDDTYYMVSTTMYFLPGCEILRSHDLVNWEHAAFVYDRLDSTDAQRLVGKENAYGQGMWAASIRFHGNKFYVVFVANDTHKTYLYAADDIAGPWKKSYIEGFYHDNSLLFDDDGRIYIVYGNKEIYLTELNENLTGPKEGGLHRLVVRDADDAYLGYEGSHIYKIGGKYYIFFIHIPRSTGRRTQSCFVADSLDGEFRGCDVFDDDGGFFGSGIAQGGIVETPSGKFYSILFRDNGAVGRIPFLVPVTFEYKEEFGCEFPVFGGKGQIDDLKPSYEYAPLYGGDDFKGTVDGGAFGFKPFWQFNHEPDLELVEHEAVEGSFKITTGKLSSNLVQAQNTLTQRTLFPRCSAEVTVDGTELNEGDYAGLCLLQSSYGFIGLTRRDGKLYLVMCSRQIDVPGIWGERKDDEPPREVECVPLEEACGAVRLRADVDFEDMKDTVVFSYAEAKNSVAGSGDGPAHAEGGCRDFMPLGAPHKLSFKLDHFTGARFGLFAYSTKVVGGLAKFTDFKYYA